MFYAINIRYPKKKIKQFSDEALEKKSILQIPLEELREYVKSFISYDAYVLSFNNPDCPYIYAPNNLVSPKVLALYVEEFGISAAKTIPQNMQKYFQDYHMMPDSQTVSDAIENFDESTKKEYLSSFLTPEEITEFLVEHNINTVNEYVEWKKQFWKSGFHYYWKSKQKLIRLQDRIPVQFFPAVPVDIPTADILLRYLDEIFPSPKEPRRGLSVPEIQAQANLVNKNFYYGFIKTRNITSLGVDKGWLINKGFYFILDGRKYRIPGNPHQDTDFRKAVDTLLSKRSGLELCPNDLILPSLSDCELLLDDCAAKLGLLNRESFQQYVTTFGNKCIAGKSGTPDNYYFIIDNKNVKINQILEGAFKNLDIETVREIIIKVKEKYEILTDSKANRALKKLASDQEFTEKLKDQNGERLILKTEFYLKNLADYEPFIASIFTTRNDDDFKKKGVSAFRAFHAAYNVDPNVSKQQSTWKFNLTSKDIMKMSKDEKFLARINDPDFSEFTVTRTQEDERGRYNISANTPFGTTAQSILDRGEVNIFPNLFSCDAALFTVDGHLRYIIEFDGGDHYPSKNANEDGRGGAKNLIKKVASDRIKNSYANDVGVKIIRIPFYLIPQKALPADYERLIRNIVGNYLGTTPTSDNVNLFKHSS